MCGELALLVAFFHWLAQLQQISDVLLDGLGHDAVGLVEGVLLGTPFLCDRDGAIHRGRDLVGVQDDHAVSVSSGTADGLNESGLAAQNQGHFRQVQPLSEQVDAHQHIKDT